MNDTEHSRQQVNLPVVTGAVGSPGARDVLEETWEPTTEAAGGSLNILGIALQSVRRWWKLTTPIGLVLGIVAACVLYHLESQPSYRASSWFRIDTRGEFIVFPTQDTSARFVETQVELVRSPLVLSPVVRDKRIGQFLVQEGVESPLAWLSSNIEVKLVGESEFLEVAFSCGDAGIAKRVVEEVSEAYRLAYERDTDLQRQQVIKLLEDEKERVAQRVEQRREDVRMQSKLALGTDPFRIDGSDALQRHAASRRAAEVLELDRQIMESKVKISLTDDRLLAYAESLAPGVGEAYLQAMGKPAPQPSGESVNAATGRSNLDAALLRRLLQSTLERSSGLTAREKALATDDAQQIQARLKAIADKQLRLQSETAARALNPSHRTTYKQRQREKEHREWLQDEANLAREAFQEYLKRVEPAILLQVRGQFKKSLLEFDRRVTDLRELEKMCELLADRQASAKLGANTGENSQVLTMDLEFARSELKSEEDIHRKVSDRLLALRTEERAPRRVTKRTEEPYVANTFSVGALYRKVAAGGVGGLLLPFGLALLWDLAQARVGDSSHARESLSLPVLGEVARIPKTGRVVFSQDEGWFAEQQAILDETVVHLAARIAYADCLQGSRVIAITSSVSGEGKSTLTSMLAAALADIHREPVLAIDTDFRNPTLPGLMGAQQGPGVSEVLSGEASLEQLVLPTDKANLFVLPTGQLSEPPRHLLGNGELRKLFSQAREQYRYVLVDTAPVLSSAETLPIAKRADATVVSTMRDVSRVSQVGMAVERLTAVGSRIAGTVINGVPPRTYRYSNGSPSRSKPRASEAMEELESS